MKTNRIRVCAILCALVGSIFLTGSAMALPASAPKVSSTVPQTWQMIDYLATDYAGAVKNGTVLSESEYAEMHEFAATVQNRIKALPPTPASPALLSQANQLMASVNAKASSTQVANQAHALAAALLKAYPIPTAPDHAPDLARGAMLYRSHCAACHGATGHGDGPAGLKLDPRPVDFSNQARADQRSPLSLYEVISHGVEGTSMASYLTELSTE